VPSLGNVPLCKIVFSIITETYMKIKIITAVALLALIAGGAFFFFYEREPDDTLTLFGNVDVRQVDLGFRVNGRVAGMAYEEGDLVEAGSLMGYLDPVPYQETLAQAKAELASSIAALQNAEWVLARRKEVVDSGAVSKESFEEAFYTAERLKEDVKGAMAKVEREETRLNDTEVFAPVEGTILTRIREPGAVVNFGEPIYTLSITSPVWVRAFVTEPQLGNIYPGMEAKIYTDTPELPVYKGHVGFISPVAEFTPKTVQTAELRTDLVYRIRVVVDNPDRLLKQGMPVTVKIDYKQESRS
jgi:HlyD family secretion protein